MVNLLLNFFTTGEMNLDSMQNSLFWYYHRKERQRVGMRPQVYLMKNFVNMSIRYIYIKSKWLVKGRKGSLTHWEYWNRYDWLFHRDYHHSRKCRENSDTIQN